MDAAGHRPATKPGRSKQRTSPLPPIPEDREQSPLLPSFTKITATFQGFPFPPWVIPSGPGLETLKLTLLLLLTACLERLDEALLPALFRSISSSLHSLPFSLTSIAFTRYLFQALASPFSAYIASVTGDRLSVIGAGAIIWGVSTAAMGVASTYWAVGFARMASAVGLGLALPCVCSLLADSHPDSSRGFVFGSLQAASQLGSLLGLFTAAQVADKALLGMPGWRTAFCLVALVSLALGLLLLMTELAAAMRTSPAPFPSSFLSSPSLYSFLSTAFRVLRHVSTDVWQVARVRTCQLLIGQEVTRQAPWHALLFLPLWLELLGMPAGRAATLMALLSSAFLLGSLMGGFLGDVASSRLPGWGRILCAQTACGFVIFLSAVLFAIMPPSRAEVAAQAFEAVLPHAAVVAALGFFSSWPVPACCWPIYAEVVPDHRRTSVYALEKLTTKLAAALGVPAAGLLAIRLYGFSTASVAAAMVGRSGTAVAAAASVAVQHQAGDFEGSGGIDAEALGKGLFFAIAIPYAIGTALITRAFFCFEEDKKQARIANWIEGSAFGRDAYDRPQERSSQGLLGRHRRDRNEEAPESLSVVRALDLEGQKPVPSRMTELIRRDV